MTRYLLLYRLQMECRGLQCCSFDVLLGYKVCFARDGQGAIEKFEEAKAGGEPFDAVIMDLTVPGGWVGRKQ